MCALTLRAMKDAMGDKDMKKTVFAFLPALAIAAAITAVVPATAQPAKPEAGGQCLRTNQIDSFSSIKGDERSLIVHDRFRNRYKLSFNTRCDDVDFNIALSIRSNETSGLSCVQRGDVIISKSLTGWTDRCVITGIQPYTVAMEKADRDAAARR